MACQNNDSSLRIWADAIDYLVTEHQGLSLHEPMTPLELCTAYVPNTERPVWLVNTTSNVFTKFETMEPDSEDYQTTVRKFDTAGNTLFDKFKHTDPDARAAYSKNNSKSAAPADSTALADALGLTQNATSANRKSATATLQLICIKRNNDNTITIPKDIQPSIVANVAKGTTATTSQNLNANIKKFHTNAKLQVYSLINIFARWQDKNKAWWSLLTTACFQTNNLATPLIINDTTAFNIFNNVPVDLQQRTS
jgi:hypothetical protein